MPQSSPTINGSPGPALALPINTLVTLGNTNSGGEVSYFWQIIDQPATGPADALSNANIQNPTFTPTKQGSYLLSLTVNGTIVGKTVAAVLDLKTLQRIPAAQETVQASTSRGWAQSVNVLLQALLDGQSDPGTMIGVAGSVNCTAGTVLYASGTSTIMSGLPEEQKLPKYDLAALPGTAITNAQINGPLFLSLGGVDGDTTPANGAIIKVRAFGLYAVTVGAAVAGDPIFVDRNGALRELTPDKIPRQVGIQVSSTHVYFDGRYAPNAAIDILTSALADVPVSAANASRLVHRTNVLQVSQAGGAYVPVALGDAPFLTNGSSTQLSNEVNIQSLTALLAFICGSSGGKVAVRRFNAGDTGAKFEIQDEGGGAIVTLFGSGAASVSGLLETPGGIDMLGADLANGGAAQFDESVGTTIYYGAQTTLASGNSLAAPTSNYVRITGVVEIRRIGTTAIPLGFCVTLLFSAGLTVRDQFGAPGAGFADIRLAGSTNFAAVANSRLELVYMSDGTTDYWFETGRVNP